MNVKRLAITLVLALCLLTAGTGSVSAADAGTDACKPAQDTPTVQSDAGTQGCTIPPCVPFCQSTVAGAKA